MRAVGIRAMAIGIAVAAGGAPSASPQQPPRLRSQIELLEVDVRVFDRTGRFVHDLTAADFEVMEEGVPQRIDVMYLVGTPGPGVAADGAGRSGGVRRSQTWIFVLDHRHIKPNGFRRTTSALQAFLGDRFRPGDLVGIVMDDKMVNNRISSVRAEYLAALEKVKTRDDARSRLADEADASYSGGGEASATIRELLTARTARERLRAARASAEMLDALANGLTRMPGPKTVVFFSDGFGVAQIEGTLRTAVGRMNRAGARVYGVDTRGLAGAPSDTLNSLAVDTGGLAFFNENNIGRALDSIAADSGIYYVLGYQPTNTRYDGAFRSIDVRVKRPDLRVRARKGYLATKPSRIRPVP